MFLRQKDNKLWWYPQQQYHLYTYMNPYAMFGYMDHGPSLLRSGFAHVDNVIASVQNNHMAAPVSGTFRALPPEPTPARPSGICRNPPEPSGTLRNLHQHTPTCRNSPEPSGTFRNLPPKPTPAPPALCGTLRNLPKPASGTYTSTPRLAELSGTLRNLPELASETYTSTSGTLQNSPQPSGTCLWNLHQHTPELARTLRNPPELREPFSGTCSCNPHRSLSGLKTPLAYAVGEKHRWKIETPHGAKKKTNT